MALVANYGASSDEEDFDDEEVPTVSKVIPKDPSKDNPPNMSSLPNSTSDLVIKKSHINFFADDESEEEDDDMVSGESTLAKFLPKPKDLALNAETAEGVEEIGPIPPKKIYGDEEELKPPSTTTFHNIKSKRTQGRIQITAPSLKDFENDEEPEAGSSRRFIQPANKKGSGLFAILPEPKSTFTKLSENTNFLKNKDPPQPSSTSTSVLSVPTSGEMASSSTSIERPAAIKFNSLIPDAVKQRMAGKRPPQTKLDEIRAKYLKKEANVQIVSRSKTAVSAAHAKDSDDSDEEASDFFNFSSKEEIDEEVLEKLKLPPPVSDEKRSQKAWNAAEETSEGNPEEALPSSSQEDVMKYLPRRRKGEAELNMIEVKADDLRPDSTEWIKNITDDSAVPVRRGKGLGGMQKRKHQITYLAFEAKAREQELQAQWAQNRASKRQTQMKYGF